MIYPSNYMVFDFETTGLDPEKDKVLEIGAIHFVNGIERARFECLIDWEQDIPKEIIDITKITNELIKEKGIKAPEALERFAAFIAESGDTVYVGHNIYKFDIPFLIKLCDLSEDFQAQLANTFVDTAAHFKGNAIKMERHFNEPYVQWVDRVMNTRAYGVKFNVAHCCEVLGIVNDQGQHRAMSDVLLTNEIYKKLCL